MKSAAPSRDTSGKRSGPGEVQTSGGAAVLQGQHYTFKQQVQAQVEYVIGEFYWKVEIGESVRATEYQGPNGKVSVEEAPTEVTHSFCAPLPPQELAQAFGLQPMPGASAASSQVLMTSGIWMKWSSASLVRSTGSGGLSTRMDTCSTRSFRAAATPRRPSAC